VTEYKSVDITCGGCGAAVATSQKTCNFCNGPVLITSFSSVYSMLPQQTNKYANSYKNALKDNPDDAALNSAVAMCYLKLKLYDKALASFEKAIQDNFDNSETYFYAAVCLLQGKKAFVTPRPVIDQIEQYIQAALMIEPRGIYHYFQAYIKYDYYQRKFFRTSPTYTDALINARSNGVSDYDTEQLFSLLEIEQPECLSL